MFSRTYRFFVFFFAASVSLTTQADELRIAVASNFADTLELLGARFEAESGHRLRLSPGSSGMHYTQIINGAPFDLFFSADAERPERLLKEGNATTAAVYALGQLILWSSDPLLVDAEGKILRSGTVRRLAFANPAQAPYGVAAREVLSALGLWDTIQPSLVQGENIAQTLQFVASGNAQLGFIAASQYVALGESGSAWKIPADLHSPIRQSYALLKPTPAAQAFIEFLNTPAARTLIERSGYTLP